MVLLVLLAPWAGRMARFFMPYSVAVDAAGTLYVTDQYNQTIRVIR